MKRSTALVGTAAAAAVLVAGSVAAMAAINTAASSAPAIESVAVVADQPTAVGSLPPIEIAPLPEIIPLDADAQPRPVIVDAVESTSKQPTVTSSAKSGTAAKPKIASSATPMTESTPQSRSISADKAAEIVVGQVEGKAQVADVTRTQHDGYDSWAVTVDKADGSRLVGYVFVGATGADVYDWKVVKEPTPIVVTVPAAGSSATNSKPTHSEHADDDDDDHGSEHSDDSHESEHDDD